MNYTIFFIIILILLLFIYSYKKEQLKLTSYGSLKNVPVEKLYELGFKQKRSGRFSKIIRDRFLSLVGVNSIRAGNRCYPEFKNLCRGSLSSKVEPCVYHNGKHICAAGQDGVKEMGILSSPNSFGNYNNGDVPHYPVKLKGCLVLGNLKPPKKYKCNKYTNKFEFYDPQPIPRMYVPKVSMSRISFQPPLPLEKSVQDNCTNAFDTENKYIEQFEENYANFCKNSITGEICALEPNKRNNKPFCKNVICPQGYNLSYDDSNICESNKEDKSCILEGVSKEANINLDDEDGDKDGDKDEDKYDKYPVCGGMNYFLSINNVDLKGGTDIALKNKNINDKECAFRCLENKDCYAYIISKDIKPICKLKKPPFLKKNILENNNKVLNYKLPLNYKFNENRKIVLQDIETYNDKSYLECATECDELSECVGFTVNKNKDATNCELKRTIIKTGPDKNIIEDSNKIVFEKITKTDNLCPLMNANKIEEKIDTNFDNINEYFQSELDYYVKQTKTEVSQDNIALKEKITNEFILQLLEEDSIIVWDNINVECDKIRIQKMDANILHISILQIFSLNEHNRIYDLIEDNTTKIIMSSELDNHKSKNLKNKDIFSYAATKSGSNSNMQYIDINLQKKTNIYKIILYNRINHYNKDDHDYEFNEKLFPFKIILYNNGKVIETAYKRVKNEQLNIVSSVQTSVADTAIADTAIADTAIADTAIADTAIADRPIDLKYKINTGFSYNNILYLIKNAKLGNNSIIKYVKIDGDTLKKKVKYPILLGSIWKLKNIHFFDKIDSAIAIDRVVFFTNGKKYTKCNIHTKEEFEGYPKLIADNWKQLPVFFHRGIDCIIPTKNDMCILYKNNRYIHYPLKLIENNNVSEINEYSFFITHIQYNIIDVFPNFPNIKWDTIIPSQNYLYIFKNDIMYRYNIKNKTYKKIKMSYQYKNLWKININKI